MHEDMDCLFRGLDQIMKLVAFYFLYILMKVFL